LNIHLSAHALFVVETTSSSAPAGDFATTPLLFIAARALVTERSSKTGNGTGKLSGTWPISAIPSFGNGHGVYRSNSDMHRLRGGVCVHRRRAGFFSRQTICERSEALQTVQGEAQFKWIARAGGDAHDVLGLRRRDDGSVQADARQAGVVPQLFLEEPECAQCSQSWYGGS
jgi:hypothetical protein